MTRFDSIYTQFLDRYAYPRELRTYKTGPYPDAVVFREGKALLDFSSSDYLGLGKHPFLIARSHEFAKRWGAGNSSSRLIRGNLSLYEDLENQVAQALGKEAALILGTGYQTNASVLEALFDAKVLGTEPDVFFDKACHASIYSSILRLKKAYRFHHNNLSHLKKLLRAKGSSKAPKFIVVESLYCMDGDQADLKELVCLAQTYQATLYVDDAHAVGLYGQDGWGKTAQLGQQIDVIMGTFSKALGSFGAYIACSAALRRYLIHRCKGLIYSTALPPPILGAISASLELLPQLEAERQQVKTQARLLHDFFRNNHLDCGSASSHIVPWIIGSAEKTRLAAQLLEEEGILGVAIQPPTVPPGKSRIRFCLSALHKAQDLEQLFKALLKVKTALEKDLVST